MRRLKVLVVDDHRLVLEALAAGKSNKEIAKQLWLAEQTVKFHLTSIYRKLGVTTRTDAIRFVYRHALTAHPALDADGVPSE